MSETKSRDRSLADGNFADGSHRTSIDFALDFVRDKYAHISAFFFVTYAFGLVKLTLDFFVGGYFFLETFQYSFILALPFLCVTILVDEKWKWNLARLGICLLFALILVLLDSKGLARGGNSSFSLLFLQLFLFMIAIEASERLFGTHRPLVEMAYFCALGLCVLHTCLILVGNFLPFIDYGEVMNRNKVSIILTCALYLRLFVIQKKPDISLSVFLTFCLFHSVINTARAALLVDLFLIALASALAVLPRVLVLRAAIFGAFLITFEVTTLTFSQNFAQFFIDSGAGSDSALSAYSRVYSNALAWDAFLESPWVGIGFEGLKNLRVAGYFTHSLPSLILASFGLIGLAAITVSVWLVIVEKFERVPHQILFSTVFLMACFTNDLHAWMGLLIGLSYSSYNEMSKFPMNRSLSKNETV